MTKEEKDTILKVLTEDRNDYARDCNRRITEESGKIKGADYIIQRFLDILKDNVESSEQPPKWTPVNEGLPSQDNEWYQCTVVANDLPMTMELFYKNGRWIDNRKLNMFQLFDIYGYGRTGEKHKLSYQELIQEFDWTEKVIAWMPLPKPYSIELSNPVKADDLDKILENLWNNTVSEVQE